MKPLIIGLKKSGDMFFKSKSAAFANIQQAISTLGIDGVRGTHILICKNETGIYYCFAWVDNNLDYHAISSSGESDKLTMGAFNWSILCTVDYCKICIDQYSVHERNEIKQETYSKMDGDFNQDSGLFEICKASVMYDGASELTYGQDYAIRRLIKAGLIKQ